MITKQFIKTWAAQYDSTKYPEAFYLTHMRVLQAKDTSSADFKTSLLALLHWKDGKATGYRSGFSTAKPNTIKPVVALGKKAVINLQKEFLRFSSEPTYKTVDFYNLLTRDMKLWGSLVIPVFVCHLARPASVPIIDQHVYRAMFVLTQTRQTRKHLRSWSQYLEYLHFYESVGSLTNASKLSDWRKIDQALWKFGQLQKDSPPFKVKSLLAKLAGRVNRANVKVNQLAERSLFHKSGGMTNREAITSACYDLGIAPVDLPPSYSRYPGSLIYSWKKRRDA